MFYHRESLDIPNMAKSFKTIVHRGKKKASGFQKKQISIAEIEEKDYKSKPEELMFKAVTFIVGNGG